MAKFVLKKKQERVSYKDTIQPFAYNTNNQSNVEDDMNTKEKIEALKAIVEKNGKKHVRTIKKDKSIIEKTESSTTILTEDNRELLKD